MNKLISSAAALAILATPAIASAKTETPSTKTVTTKSGSTTATTTVSTKGNTTTAKTTVTNTAAKGHSKNHRMAMKTAHKSSTKKPAKTGA